MQKVPFWIHRLYFYIITIVINNTSTKFHTCFNNPNMIFVLQSANIKWSFQRTVDTHRYVHLYRISTSYNVPSFPTYANIRQNVSSTDKLCYLLVAMRVIQKTIFSIKLVSFGIFHRAVVTYCTYNGRLLHANFYPNQCRAGNEWVTE